MSGVNKVILIGNVGKDPEVRYLEGNVPVAKFSLATNETYKNKEGAKVDQTEWHHIVLWRGLAEIAEKYVRKGSLLYIEGKIKTRSWEDKDGQKKYMTEVVCEAQSLVLLGGGGGRGDSSEGGGDFDRPVSMPRSAQRPQASSSPQPPDDFQQGITDDDVPF